MPGMDGLQVAARLCEREAPPAVVFCTGDDEFTVDPSLVGSAPITVIGGETVEEAVIDPTNNPGGRLGDGAAASAIGVLAMMLCGFTLLMVTAPLARSVRWTRRRA